jgi:hypothetical protein
MNRVSISLHLMSFTRKHQSLSSRVFATERCFASAPQLFENHVTGMLRRVQ